MVDIIASSAVNDDATVNERSQPNRGNKISKKNKKKSKNQDWDDESEGNILNILYWLSNRLKYYWLYIFLFI